MKTKLMMMGALAVACAVNELAAMPTEQETRQAEPAVKRLLLQQRTELRSGRKTRSDVALLAMKRASEAKTEAEKLLLMKGAFALYVQDGNLEKAAETMNVLKKTIPDLPQESVKNMVETALKGAPKNVDGERLRKLLGEAKAKNNGPAGSGDCMATVDGYSWSYRVKNGEATIVAEKDGRHSCAVSPAPTGNLNIPATLDGFKVTGIGWESFRGCKGLKSVTVPEGVTHIDYAFLECADLESVKLPSSLKSIGYGTFARCIALESVTIPNGVENIEADAFNGCVKVKSLVIPESVTHIGDRAFCAWAALESVAFSSGVVNIGTGVFAGCNALKLIIVDSGNQAFTAVDGVLYTKDRSELVMWPNPRNAVVIPDGVTKIRGWAFAFGEGMTSVTIPESVTRIDEVVFIGCAGLKSVTIPSRVKSIGAHVFERCSELTEVTMLGERPEAPKTLFPGCGNLKAIHVPANAKSWAGMKEWFGIPLVFDGEQAAANLLPESLSAELEEALVGYWTFDGNANDATRYRNNGTLHGVTPAEDRHGKANKAYRFNGSSYIEVPHSETLNMTHAITLTAWIKPHRWWGYNGWAIIMQKGDKRNCNYQFGMAMRDNRVYLCGNDISSRCGQLGLELNKWQQVALTYESGKSLCLYRDGVQIGTWKFGQDLQPNNGRLLIGYDPFWSSEYFIGNITSIFRRRR